MKTSSISHFRFLSAVLLLFAFSCKENDQVPSPLSELSNEAKAFLGLQSGANKFLFTSGNAMINKSFQGAYNSYASGSGVAGVSVDPDSTVVGPYPWQTCADITEINNPDGSITVITDYGDGCDEGSEEYHYFMHGKYTYTYKYEQSQSGAVFTYVYLNRNVAENYGGKYYYNNDSSEWLTNSHSTYSGESRYDTAKQTFSGFYSYSDTSEYEYDHVTYTSQSVGKATYTEKKSVFEINNYQYAYGNDYYKSTMLKPLVMDYTCSSMMNDMIMAPFWFTYVSGRERIQYKQDGKSGEFEIDYGDGACDNIILIYENGKIFKIDLMADYAALQVKGG